MIGINQQINTTSGGNEGVGFAVPINLVKSSLDQLRENGEAKYPYIGVSSQALYPQLADEARHRRPDRLADLRRPAGQPGRGRRPQGLLGGDDSTVEFQGREVKVGGDVIMAVDGEKLVAENDLSRLIAEHQPGDKITLSIIRDGDADGRRRDARHPSRNLSALTVGGAHPLRELVVELASDLREVVLPELGGTAGREHAGDGAGGDVTFAIDERAESRMEEFLAERAPDVAFYSEDRGMVTPGGRAALGSRRRPDRRHPPGDGRVRVGLRVCRRRAARW